MSCFTVGDDPHALRCGLRLRRAGHWQFRIERHSIVAATDVRPKITLACQECKHRNYITKKNRRNDPDRLELKKYCPNCRCHQPHRETR